MKKHCDKMRIFAYEMYECLYDFNSMHTMNYPEDSGLFADTIMLSRALQDKLEIILAYYEHKGHLP